MKRDFYAMREPSDNNRIQNVFNVLEVEFKKDFFFPKQVFYQTVIKEEIALLINVLLCTREGV